MLLPDFFKEIIYAFDELLLSSAPSMGTAESNVLQICILITVRSPMRSKFCQTAIPSLVNTKGKVAVVHKFNAE